MRALDLFCCAGGATRGHEGPVVGIYGAHVRDRRRPAGLNHNSGSNRPWSHAFIANPRSSHPKQRTCFVMTKPTPKPIDPVVDPMPIDPVATTPPPPSPDPFDIESLRVGPEYTQQIAVKKLLTRIPMHKPHAQHWVRAHSDPALR
ncbi:MAG TPA: hypothetical protein VFE60_00210, partial [Roseiarcus sp.]|nr:hypothetical protein [Roseiarcus sp.]